MNKSTLDDAAKAIAEKASEPGTFTFLDRLLGRNYPTDEVKVYLDEALGYKVTALREKVAGIKDPEVAEPIEAEIEELDRQLNENVAIFVLQGTTNEAYDELVDGAYEQFPAEYEETTNPFSGRKEKTELPNEERTRVLQNAVWAKFVKEIRMGDQVQHGITEGEANLIRGQLPINGTVRVQEVIQKLRMATNWMDSIQDEGFLAGR